MDLFSQFRKGLASFTLTAMVATLFVAPSAQAALDFTDASEIPSWADEAIGELMDQGVIGGNDDGSFAPNRQLNRAEVSKIIVLATGIDFDTTGGPNFPDVDEDAWFYDYVETMYNAGWVNGYPDGMFRPGVGINRAEIAKMVVNAFEIDQDLSGAPHFDDVSESDWFYGYIETAYNNGLMRGYGDGTFGPSNAVTRAETSKIVYDGQLVVAEPVGPAEGTLEVTLSDDTPRGTNVPYNSTSVPFTTVEMTASDDSDVEVSSVTFTRLGLGDNDDFDNVWLEIDGFKVGNDKSVNNDDIVELRFNPPVVIPAGQTIVADVVASAKFTSSDKNVGHHNRLALVSADDIVSTAANVAGDFPIEGEEMEVADYEVSEVEFTDLGSDTTVDVGDNFIEIGKFRMLNTSNTNKDVEVRAITFKNDGTGEIEDNLENVALYVSGEQVSAETIIDGDYVTFRLDNGVTGGYILEDGDSRIFSVRADIVSAEKDDTIQFKVDNFEDIVGVEIGTSFGVKAVDEAGNNAEDANATLKTYTIDSGDLNISRDPSSLGNQGYAPGSNDIVALTARLVVDQPLIVDGVTINVASGSVFANGAHATGGADSLLEANAQFDNFRLFLNDKLIDSENDFAYISGTTDVVTNYKLAFNTTFEIAGTSILKVVANIKDAAVDTSKLKLEVTNTAFDSPEYISTGDLVTSSQVLGSAQSSFVEVQKSILKITKTDGLSSGDKIVAGVDDVTFLKFVLDNNDSGDVNVTSVTVDSTATGKARTTSNFTAAVFVDGTQQGSAKNLNNTTGDATFNDLSVVIPSAGQKEFTVVLDTIESSATVVSQTATASVNNTSVTVSTANAALLTVGDVLQVTPKVVLSAAAASTNGTEVETGAITAINAGVVSATGAYGSTAAGSAGDTTFTVATAGVNGDTLVITDDLANTLCTIAFTNGGTSDTDCTDGAGLINPTVDGTATQQADRLATFTFSGYTTSNNGASNTTWDMVETATPFIAGNVNSAETGTLVVNDTNSVAGVVTVDNPIVNLKHTLQLQVTAVDADNVENGQTVTVNNGANLLSASALNGITFELVQSGSLTVSLDSTVFSDIVVANATDVEVLKIRFNAADDEVQIRDIYLENDISATPAFEDRADFKLYNESGQLVQQKQMAGNELHFELADQDRIRVPKDDSTFVTIKVDVRDITKANQTGARLQLALDADGSINAFKGLEAVTAATGSDIDVPAAGWGDATGQDFVAYRSDIAVKHATSGQPAISDPQAGSQEVYRFTVTADAARQVELGRTSFAFSVQGMKRTAGNFASGDFLVRQVKTDGTIDSTSSVATVTASGGSTTAATLNVDFTNQKLSAGESRTYAVFVANTANDGSNLSDDDSFSFTILRDTAYATPDSLADQKTASQVLIWSDESSTSHATTTNDWLNGFLVDIDTSAFVNSDPN